MVPIPSQHLSNERANYPYTIQLHVVEEEWMQQIRVVWQDSSLPRCSNRKVKGVYTVCWHHDIVVQPELVRPEFEIHSCLVNAQVGAVANHDKSSDVSVLVQPAGEPGADACVQ